MGEMQKLMQKPEEMKASFEDKRRLFGKTKEV